MATSTRALEDGEQEHAREVLRRVVADEFKGNQSAAKKALGISQQTISKMLGTTRGPVGLYTVRKLAKYLKRDEREIMGTATPTGAFPADEYPLRAELRVLSAFRDAPQEVQQYLLDNRNFGADLASIDEWIVELRRAERLHRDRRLNALRPGEAVEDVPDPDAAPPKRKARRRSA